MPPPLGAALVGGASVACAARAALAAVERRSRAPRQRAPRCAFSSSGSRGWLASPTASSASRMGSKCSARVRDQTLTARALSACAPTACALSACASSGSASRLSAACHGLCRRTEHSAWRSLDVSGLLVEAACGSALSSVAVQRAYDRSHALAPSAPTISSPAASASSSSATAATPSSVAHGFAESTSSVSRQMV